jgi:3-oxoadipate enol-lactonase
MESSAAHKLAIDLSWQYMPTIVRKPGLRLHYLDENSLSAHPVLLIHGLGVSSTSWQLQIEPLVKSGFRVIAPDCRGFGRSSYPGKTSIQSMANDLIQLLSELGLENLHIVGISMGGVIAQQMAVNFQNSINSLVLVNTFAHLHPPNFCNLAYFASRLVVLFLFGLPKQARLVANNVFPHPEQEALRQLMVEQICQSNPIAYKRTILSLARFDSRIHLKRIQCPILIITGENDTTVPPDLQNELASFLPAAERQIIPNSGHASIADQPEAFNACLLQFLLKQRN